MATCGSKKKLNQRDMCLDEIGLSAQNLLTIFGSIFKIIGHTNYEENGYSLELDLHVNILKELGAEIKVTTLGHLPYILTCSPNEDLDDETDHNEHRPFFVRNLI